MDTIAMVRVSGTRLNNLEGVCVSWDTNTTKMRIMADEFKSMGIWNVFRSGL